MLEQGIDINLKNSEGRTPLISAAYKGKDGKVMWITKKINKNSISCLGNATMVKILLENGADPNISDRAGRFPIIHAAARSKFYSWTLWISFLNVFLVF